MTSTKFKIGDLIIYPAGVAGDPFDDYGVVIDIVDTTIAGSLEIDYAYVIMWAIEGEATTEEWWWCEENLLLVSRP
tara:strand:- start:595 stop:822 length:228 start_codon:yes stop_codon:yes gene_type:complete